MVVLISDMFVPRDGLFRGLKLLRHRGHDGEIEAQGRSDPDEERGPERVRARHEAAKGGHEHEQPRRPIDDGGHGHRRRVHGLGSVGRGEAEEPARFAPEVHGHDEGAPQKRGPDGHDRLVLVARPAQEREVVGEGEVAVEEGGAEVRVVEDGIADLDLSCVVDEGRDEQARQDEHRPALAE